jgi:hypothetical protein
MIRSLIGHGQPSTQLHTSPSGRFESCYCQRRQAERVRLGTLYAPAAGDCESGKHVWKLRCDSRSSISRTEQILATHSVLTMATKVEQADTSSSLFFWNLRIDAVTTIDRVSKCVVTEIFINFLLLCKGSIEGIL